MAVLVLLAAAARALVVALDLPALGRRQLVEDLDLLAIDTVWLLIDPHGYRALTRDRGWAPERFEQWFVDSVHRLLLADEPAARRRRAS